MQRVTGTEVDLCLELEGLIGHVPQAVAPRDFVEMHEHLVQRETLSYAMPRTGRERHVCETRPLRLVPGREAPGLEGLRVLPEVWMPVQQVEWQQHVGARRHRVAAEHIRLDRAPRKHPARRIEAQRFIDYLAGIAQLFHLRE